MRRAETSRSERTLRELSVGARQWGRPSRIHSVSSALNKRFLFSRMQREFPSQNNGMLVPVKVTAARRWRTEVVPRDCNSRPLYSFWNAEGVFVSPALQRNKPRAKSSKSRKDGTKTKWNTTTSKKKSKQCREKR